jgi:hypothetical protein
MNCFRTPLSHLHAPIPPSPAQCAPPGTRPTEPWRLSKIQHGLQGTTGEHVWRIQSLAALTPMQVPYMGPTFRTLCFMIEPRSEELFKSFGDNIVLTEPVFPSLAGATADDCEHLADRFWYIVNKNFTSSSFSYLRLPDVFHFLPGVLDRMSACDALDVKIEDAQLDDPNLQHGLMPITLLSNLRALSLYVFRMVLPSLTKPCLLLSILPTSAQTSVPRGRCAGGRRLAGGPACTLSHGPSRLAPQSTLPFSLYTPGIRSTSSTHLSSLGFCQCYLPQCHHGRGQSSDGSVFSVHQTPDGLYLDVRQPPCRDSHRFPPLHAESYSHLQPGISMQIDHLQTCAYAQCCVAQHYTLLTPKSD